MYVVLAKVDERSTPVENDPYISTRDSTNAGLTWKPTHWQDGMVPATISYHTRCMQHINPLSIHFKAVSLTPSIVMDISAFCVFSISLNHKVLSCIIRQNRMLYNKDNTTRSCSYRGNSQSLKCLWSTWDSPYKLTVSTHFFQTRHFYDVYSWEEITSIKARLTFNSLKCTVSCSFICK